MIEQTQTAAEKKAFIENYILEAIDSSGYDASPETPEDKVEFLLNTFESEYSWSIDRNGKFNAFIDWLQGLPSCFNIAFTYSDVIDLAKRQGSLMHNATEKQEDNFCEKYYRYMTVRVFELYRKLTGKDYRTN